MNNFPRGIFCENARPHLGWGACFRPAHDPNLLVYEEVCKGAGLAGWQQEAVACCALLSEQGANTTRDSLSRALHEQCVELCILQRSAFA